jgi:phosphohistidine swiveling domain-containing protein
MNDQSPSTTSPTTSSTTSSTIPSVPPFEAPGPGTWERDISHCTPSATLVFRRVASETMRAAYRTAFAEFGAPLETMDVRFVNGKMYRRLVPLVGADKDAAPPPAPVLWLVTRLHPAFRRRERTAQRLWVDRPFLGVIAEWERVERAAWAERDRARQAVDVASIDDEALAAHLLDVDTLLMDGWLRHHVLHASDIGPIGDLLVHARRWGIEPLDALSCLRGASPATVEAAEHGRRIADALRDAGVDPSTVRDLDVVRAVPAAAAALDAYLAEAGWRVVTSYDLEALTIGEMPSAVCALIRSAATEQPATDDAPARAAELRARVPVGERDTFDTLLSDARRAYGMRDDNGPLTAEWPMGLLRRAFLEAGRRLAASGRLHDPAHVMELDTPEVAAALRGAPAPSADDALHRAGLRRAEAVADAPAVLGPPPVEPDVGLLPPALRRPMEIVQLAVSLLERPIGEAVALAGTGIGHAPYRGVARVSDDPERMFEQMEPGDVLVAPWTAPTYNAVFAIAGAAVVQEGGPLCHAAVMARELGIPAVIGCSSAMEEIGNGDLIEVDPVAGRVRIVERAVAATV